MNPLDYLTIPIADIVGEIREATRTQLNSHGASAALVAAGINLEKLIDGIARNAAQCLHGLSVEEKAEQ